MKKLSFTQTSDVDQFWVAPWYCYPKSDRIPNFKLPDQFHGQTLVNKTSKIHLNFFSQVYVTRWYKELQCAKNQTGKSTSSSLIPLDVQFKSRGSEASSSATLSFKRSHKIKGQIISKGLLVSSYSPKIGTNERMNERTNLFFATTTNSFFVFWENLRTPKGPFEVI